MYERIITKEYLNGGIMFMFCSILYKLFHCN